MLRRTVASGPEREGKSGRSKPDVYSDSDGWGIAPLVSMVNPTDTGQSDDLGRGSRPGPGSSLFHDRELLPEGGIFHGEVES